MATITGYGSKHSHEFKLTVNETSTSVVNNTSEVSFSFTIYKASYSWSGWNSITYTITINGTSYTGTIPSYSAGSTMTIRTGSQTIAHNSDGTKSISYSFSVSDGSGQSYTCGNASASGTMSLTKINRYPTFTTKPYIMEKTINTIKFHYGAVDIISDLYYSLDNSNWVHMTTYTPTITGLKPETNYTIYVQARNQVDNSLRTTASVGTSTYAIAKITSAPNANIGSNHTVTWSNPSGESTSLKLCKTDGTSVIDYGTVTGTSKSITPTASTIYALTPNSNKITLRYIITTTANSTSYTNYKDCVFTVTNSNPTFSNFTYQDTNATTVALTGNNQILVKGYSNIKGIISTTNKATAKNSATMSTYKMVIGSKSSQFNYNSSAEVSTTINNINSNIIDLYAIDSRGNSTKISKTATYKEYSEPTIQSVTVTRSSNGVGKEVTLKFNGTIWNNSFGEIDNKIKTCKYQYKLTSSNDWKDGNTELTYTISDNKFSGNLTIKGDLEAEGFSVENSFNIRLVVSDELITKTYDVILGSGTPAIAVYKDSVAIGQKYDTSEGSKLQVNGKTLFKDETTLSKSSGDTGYYAKRSDTGVEVWMGVGSGGINHGIYSDKLNKWLVHADASHAYFNGIMYDISTENTLDTWVPVLNSGKVQHRVIAANINNALPVSLYENSSGTTGTVTLSETAANFSYLEIFYTKADTYNSVKVYSPNGKIANMFLFYQATSEIMQHIFAQIKISGTSITKSSTGSVNYSFSGLTATALADDSIKIHKVIGYR